MSTAEKENARRLLGFSFGLKLTDTEAGGGRGARGASGGRLMGEDALGVCDVGGDCGVGRVKSADGTGEVSGR